MHARSVRSHEAALKKFENVAESKSKQAMATSYKFGPFRLDAEAEVLFRGGATTGLGRRPVALLRVLLQRPGVLISKELLIDAAWRGLAVEESNLPVQIAAVRRVLGEEPRGETWIETLPRRGYRFVGPVVVVEEGQGHVAKPGHQQLAEPSSKERTPDRPSIAVLPFLNLSGRPDQQYFGDAIADDIITALTRFRWFFVVARNSSFAFRNSDSDVRQIANQLGVRYVVEGSHRQVGERIRITAHSDTFAIQDEITDSIVGAIEPELLKTESRSTAASRTADMTAWDLVRRGVWHFHQVGRETHEQARDFFRAAAKLDPQLTEAHIWLARVSGGIVLWGWTDDPTSVSQEGLTAALTAIRLDDKNAYAHYGLAITSCGANHLEQATRAAEKAIELSPSFALAHLVLGMAQLYSGRAHEATASLQHGLRLNSYDPHNFVWFDLLALAHLFIGETEQALQAATKALKIRPALHLTLETMALCCAAVDRMGEARHCFEAMYRLSSQPSSILAPLRARNPRWGEEMAKLLQKAHGAQ